MGSDPIALPLLEWMVGPAGSELLEITAIYTQPDRAVGRGQKIVANGIKTWAMERNIPVRQPAKLTDEVRAELAGDQPDVAVVMAYGHILRESFITTPRLGTLNLHASILPDYRGASPIQSAIIRGDDETGVALMRIVKELDAGPVADIERVPIAPLDTALEIEAKLANACVPLVARNMPKLVSGTMEFAAQDHSQASFCRKLTKADGALDFRTAATVLAARINGLHPWPGCRVEIKGQIIRIGLAEAASGEGPPGRVIAIDRTALVIGTGRGVLRLLRLQRPGGRMLPAAEFLRGFPLDLGDTLPSQSMPTLVKSAKSS